MNFVCCLTYLVVLLTTCTEPASANVIPPPCTAPTAADLQLQLYNEYIDPSVAYVGPSSAETNTTCPAGDHVPATTPAPPRSRSSTCPWSYRTDYDAERYPSEVTQAVCSCEGCLDAHTSEELPDRTCSPVRYRMPVLRRVCGADGVYTVQADFESITVACVCLREPGQQARRPPGILG